jgi:uncharacterized membrane protein YraQ (UPF0718 family)
MLLLYAITILALVFSFMANRQKTRQALKIAIQKFLSVTPDLFTMIVLVSISLYFLPATVIVKYLGMNNIFQSVIIALVLGSITMMPGFVAFPLCGLLLRQGVPYMVLGIFTTTLMMVGIVTFPLERSYFGTKVTLMRNGMSLIIALLVGLLIGIFYGELI